MKFDYDLFVIGAGAAGLTVAFTALGLGKKVALAEMNKPGGECTHYGCVPSKALLHAAEKGIPNPLKYVKGIIDKVYQEESFEVLEEKGISVFRNNVVLIDSNMIDCGDGNCVTAKLIYICTGSSPMIPEIEGIIGEDFLTNETIFSLNEIPESLVIIGAGAIACEMACAFNALGTEIAMIVRSTILREGGDSDISDAMEETLRERGIKIFKGFLPVAGSKNEKGFRIEIKNKDGVTHFIEGERLFAATGRIPRLKGYGLESVGIECGEKGILVDSKMRTSKKNIFAVGDVTGPFRFSHSAEYQGIKAAFNGIFPVKTAVDYTLMGWVVFTFPEEVAHLGTTEFNLEKQGKYFKEYRVNFDETDRGKASLSKGFLKVYVNRKGNILGATIFGERGGEMIHILQTAMRGNIPFHKLSDMVYYYPTFCDLIKKASRTAKKERILNHPVVKLIQSLKN